MKPAFLVSVMHTGTTWLLDTIKPTGGYHHVHSHMEDIVLPKCREAQVVIAPLRDPRSVWRSFTWRNEPRTYFWDGWRHMNQIDKEFGVHFVPVDLPDVRDECLRKVTDAIGTDAVEPDWEPRGAYPGSRFLVRDFPDMTEIYDYPFVRKFYGADVG